jgi:pSer/pThr/pTyr-binding forkhead associated (FHA) protein
MARLIVQSGDWAGRPFDLIEDRLTVGRSADNNIRVEDKTISSHHATLTFDGNDYVLKDLNSTNGSRVNGRRITEVKLSHGDHVRLGHVELRYESEARKSGQPLPPTARGVDLTTTTPLSVTPVSLTSASPFRRRTNKSHWILNGIIALLVLVAVVGIALLLKEYVFSSH